MLDTDVWMALVTWSESNGTGEVFKNVGFMLPDGSMRGPRIAWASNAKMSALTEQDRKGFPPVCPDFVVEILSFNYALPELQARMRGWIANGVELAWLFIPSRKSVEAYRPGREPEVVEGDRRLKCEGPLAGFVVELAEIWEQKRQRRSRLSA
jgi:Uma2 family endonuclease